jgi:hypothetical protein
MLFADDLGGAIADVMAGFAIFLALVAAGLIFYWVLLVPLSYGYYTWKEYIFKHRSQEVTWPQRLCSFLFAMVVFVFVDFPGVASATKMILSIGNSHEVWENFQVFFAALIIGAVLWVLMEMMIRIRWQQRVTGRQV